MDATAQPDAHGPSYEVFGVVLATRHELATALVETTATPDVVFELVDAPLIPETSWGPPLREEAGEFALYRVHDCEVLHFIDEATFFLMDQRIFCFLPDSSRRHVVEIRLLGAVLAYWLESRGIPTLHASAVVVGDRAVAFVSGNGGGKTSLAAELMRRGHRMLTDDILPIDVRNEAAHGRPGYPQMRMWPAEAERFVGTVEGLVTVHPAFDKLRVPVGGDGLGDFCREATTLGTIYFLNPVATREPPRFERVPPHETVMLLVAAGFAARVAGVAPQAAERFHTLGKVATSVPVWWLTYGRQRSTIEDLTEEVLVHMRDSAGPADTGGR